MKDKSQRLYQKAKTVIPGGTQLLSKRPEMFLPDLWPAYYEKARGCEVWDLDGKKYLDFSYMGIGACVLGYADKDVDRAVTRIIKKSSMCTLNSPEEYELANILLRLHPWAQKVRYARGGGEAMAMAVRIARAYTKKDTILFCGYHGWHDWYLAANLNDNAALDGHLIAGLQPKGVPRALTGSAIPFKYNDTSQFSTLIKKYYHELGAIVMEPIRNYQPHRDFLTAINREKNKYKVPLIIDEVSSGFRLNTGGAHLLFNFHPDIAVFAKAISNGYPLAAIIGKKEIMEAAQDTFISSTNWTERIGPTAGIAAITKFSQKKVARYLSKTGAKVKHGWQTLAKKYALPLEITGINPLLHFSFQTHPLILKTLFTQLMLERGFLATNAFYASFAHKQTDINRYLHAVDETFSIIAKAAYGKHPEKYLKGPVCHAGFQRLN